MLIDLTPLLPRESKEKRRGLRLGLATRMLGPCDRVTATPGLFVLLGSSVLSAESILFQRSQDTGACCSAAFVAGNLCAWSPTPAS